MPPRSRHLLHYAWAAPASVVGLVLTLAALALGASAHVVGGVLEVAGGRFADALARLPHAIRFDAITLGHVILGTTHATLARLRPHEYVHIRQYERWGPLFFPLYLASSLWQFVCGRDPYYDNRFEREAFDRSLSEMSGSDATFQQLRRRGERS